MNNSIRVNCTKKNLKLIRDFVTEYLRALSLTEIQLNQIVLAVDEICANLIIHANHEDPNKHITIRILRVKGDTLKFEISARRAAWVSPSSTASWTKWSSAATEPTTPACSTRRSNKANRTLYQRISRYRERNHLHLVYGYAF